MKHDTVVHPFEPRHCQALEMLVADHDGPKISVKTPLRTRKERHA